MRISDQEMRQILEKVVRWHLTSQKVKNLSTLEEKAEEIRHQCFVGGGTDTCNLIGHYDDLGGEILNLLKEYENPVAKN